MPSNESTGNTKKRRPVPEPPAEQRALIGPREIAQMADRRRQIALLRKMIADREGRDDGR